MIPAKILIVEGDWIAAEDLRDILTVLGYSVTAVVSSGAHAIAEAEANLPDLALIDIRIQGAMDGAEAARILRERWRVPVVYLTAHTEAGLLERPLVAQPLGYITKPFRDFELRTIIEIALDRVREIQNSTQRALPRPATLCAHGMAVIVIDASEKIVHWNPAAEAWTGWSSAEALDKPVWRLLSLDHVSQAEELDAPWGAVLVGGSSKELKSGTLLIDRGGERRHIEGSIAPTRGVAGGLAGAVIVFGPAGGERGPVSHLSLSETLRRDRIGFGGFEMIVASPAMQRLVRLARSIAESNVRAVLLEGERGTGKTSLARFLHHRDRRDAPFVALNCAGMNGQELETQLFGFEAGAFKGAGELTAGVLETAQGGTIFLDGITEMPLNVQAKIVSVLEERTFRRLGGLDDIPCDVHLLAGTTRPLASAVTEGKCRLDLFYRLNAISVLLPRLRERIDDVVPLAEHFVRAQNQLLRREVRGLSYAAAAMLLAHDWPGNVSELRDAIADGMECEASDWIHPFSLSLGSGRRPLKRATGLKRKATA